MCLKRKYKMNPTFRNHLNNYRVLKKLGSGGFANVKLYQCRNTHDGNKCNELFVIKKLRLILTKKKSILIIIKLKLFFNVVLETFVFFFL